MKVNSDALMVGGIAALTVGMFAWKVTKAVKAIKSASATVNAADEEIRGWTKDYSNHNLNTHVTPEGHTRTIRDVN